MINSIFFINKLMLEFLINNHYLEYKIKKQNIHRKLCYFD